MQVIFFIIIPFLYASMHSLDCMASYSRVAGYLLNKNALGYSIQNSSVAFTRIFSMMLLPILGYLIDKNITSKNFLIICLISFLLNGIFNIFVYLNSNVIINFYLKKIQKLINSDELKIIKFDYHFSKGRVDKKVIYMALFVYTINGISVLLTFYLATLFENNKVMLTQMSGMITASATFILTIKLDPLMSTKIEVNDSFIENHRALIKTRILTALIFCPAVFFLIFILTKI